MNLIESTKELRKYKKDFPHAGLFQGDRKLISINTRAVPVEKLIEKIIERLESKLTPGGDYEIHFKTVNRSDIEPVLIYYHKPGGLVAEQQKEQAPQAPQGNTSAELTAAKLQFYNDEYVKKIAALEQENERLKRIVTEQEDEISELEETVNNLHDESPAQTALLSEQNIKPIENILAILTPVFQPYFESQKQLKDLEYKMKLSEFNFRMQQKYKQGQRIEKGQEPAPVNNDDELISYLRNLKDNSPQEYHAVYQMFVSQQSQEQNTENE